MAKYLKLDREQISQLVTEFRLAYKKRSYVTVKECPPAKLYEKVGVPVGGVIAKYFIDFLLKKDYMTQQGKRIISYRWCDQIHDPDSIADRFIQHLNSVINQTKEVPSANIVDPNEFQLGDKVFVLANYEIYEGYVSMKSQSWSKTKGSSDILYNIYLPGRYNGSDEEVVMTNISSKLISRSVDGLLIKLKESVNYIKNV